jgi:predicted nuclease of predicted toxin-antitoxin system
LKIKLDENLSRHLKTVLAGLGHDVTTAADEGLLSRPDEAVGAAAKNEGRMIFTLDVGFVDIRKYPPGEHPGIVLFRPDSLGPLAVNRAVSEFAATQKLEMFSGCVVVVESDRIRVRRPEIGTDG